MRRQTLMFNNVILTTDKLISEFNFGESTSLVLDFQSILSYSSFTIYVIMDEKYVLVEVKESWLVSDLKKTLEEEHGYSATHMIYYL